jgi:acetyl-CoA C-acetyltransferase
VCADSATRLALDQAGVRLADVALLDIYSCFPSAVQIALQEMGLCASDRRDLTVTGGLWADRGCTIVVAVQG